jgi:hypothetical protein
VAAMAGFLAGEPGGASTPDSHEADCPRCRGKGCVICPECQGTGEKRNESWVVTGRCPQCVGPLRGFVLCPKCGGLGKISGTPLPPG